MKLRPKLRSASWPVAAHVPLRRLSARQPELAQNPVVTVQIEVGGKWVTALPEAGHDLVPLAVHDLDEARPAIEVQPLESNPISLARIHGELAPELVLSPWHMRAVQTQLGAAALAVAVPNESSLLAVGTTCGGSGDLGQSAAGASAGSLGREPQEALRVFASYANRYFALAEQRGISPLLFLVVDGELVGAIDPLPPRPKVVLFARCEAEAQLYMDLRGVERDPPPARTIVLLGDQHATVFTANVDGAQETFAFVIGDPNGKLGTGGVSGPSAIIGPSELLTFADILTKRHEATAAQVILSAECVEEVLKFIPHGASAVPESAFMTDAARAMYAKEPGRFNGARLEAVANAYRKFAANKR